MNSIKKNKIFVTSIITIVFMVVYLPVIVKIPVFMVFASFLLFQYTQISEQQLKHALSFIIQLASLTAVVLVFFLAISTMSQLIEK